ncbi:RNA-binding protein lark-like [Diabrotica virgifera virgifera]|uniref:RNA-binding protein lark-like n=2 Tax=Diabrotica virgifera virgifera TaxID=50390 RepID=A0ABM5L9H6_DIAVI|nr:RNA-binding protein lark-like [Diabrotica virgifera virgifera]
MASFSNAGTFKIFIGNLSKNIGVAELSPLFENYGTVVECSIIKNYGFVRMENATDGWVAINNLNGHILKGRPMKCEPAKGRNAPLPPTTKIFVGNLRDNTKAPQIRELFEQYGTVVECDIIRNYGFVHLHCSGIVDRAVRALNGTMVGGQRMTVKLATSRLRRRPGWGASNRCYKCGRSGHCAKQCHVPYPKGMGAARYPYPLSPSPPMLLE